MKNKISGLNREKGTESSKSDKLSLAVSAALSKEFGMIIDVAFTRGFDE
ncbi:MAG: hypothetical protein ACRESZ_14260 [Methylococcales bacterium]